jgi:hypothetical protein
MIRIAISREALYYPYQLNKWDLFEQLEWMISSDKCKISRRWVV